MDESGGGVGDDVISRNTELELARISILPEVKLNHNSSLNLLDFLICCSLRIQASLFLFLTL